MFLKYKEKFQNLHPFQKEIIINIFKEPNGREYTKDFKKYCYCLYNRSPSKYELLRVILPFPTYKTLHSTFQNEISEYRKYIENVDFCSEILKLKETQLKEEFMPSVLSIDAFTTTIF